MATLDRIVNVQISLNTTAIKEQSFSDLLVIGPHAVALPRVMAVTGADQLLELGISSTDPLYMAVRDVFAQIPTLNRCFVGRRHVDTVDIDVTRASESVYRATLQWRDETGAAQSATATYTGLPADTPALIATGLAGAIAATAAPVEAVAAGAVITLTADVDGAAFSVDVAGNLALQVPTSTESMTDALAACRRENDDWYGVVLTSRVEADVLSAAEWVESNAKLMGVGSAQAGILDAGVDTDIASKLQERQFFRTAVWYHERAALEWLEAAVAANRFTFYPGGETWANVRLTGITADNLAEGEAITAHNKNANTFEPFRNFAITQNGRVAAGEWIDVIRFRDWLAEQMKISVVSALINANGKVPYTDGGIQVVTTAMRQTLDLGVTRGGIAPEELDDTGRKIPSYTISAPRAANVPFNDKANRVLNDVSFTARLAGAIHAVNIKGTLTYAL
ncbi:DUF3383 domain-containing protein [Cupriavidus respiraculi]|uniref:DUF3383 domain-containing protein n=1 Tax=Cupriavidus respiraculi TaxID=195930 RepID=A0ABM8WZS6_9BURK|nr:DUF3383 family protein [Cupriavidus respiraculi]CAG9173080.1 hypothetical protein LMG21510_02151 [Cupriavidus respiraculi]